MTSTLDDRYFEWLYKLIGAVRNRNPARSHWGLARQLYVKEFVWLVPNDDNRVEDGRELRLEFIHEQEIDEVDHEWMSLGCSMLEMLIGLARRLSFEADGNPTDWFWTLIENMGLDNITDAVYSDEVAQDIDEKLDLIIYRNYARSGAGGLFPLRNPPADQRKVELWYQMSAYLLERVATF